MRSTEPGISRFRVWSFGPCRNDGSTYRIGRARRNPSQRLNPVGGLRLRLTHPARLPGVDRTWRSKPPLPPIDRSLKFSNLVGRAGVQKFLAMVNWRKGQFIRHLRLPSEADTNRKGRHVRWGPKPVLTVKKRHFQSTPSNGRRRTAPACLKRAKPGRIQGEQISSEMRSRADIETASRRSVSQKQRSTDESDRGSALWAEFDRHAVRNRTRGAVAC